MGNYSVFHRIYNRLDVHFQLCGKLLVKCQLDPLNVVAQLDGWSQLQIHALLYRWQVQQQQCLSIDLLNKTNKQKKLVRGNIRERQYDAAPGEALPLLT